MTEALRSMKKRELTLELTSAMCQIIAAARYKEKRIDKIQVSE
jgi:hypothetical protein